jgi:hypothetical protein
MASRERNYVITMAFRMACFVSIFFVHGWVRWVVLAGAVFLPLVAVLFANQANTKNVVTSVEPGSPAPAPQLTTGQERSADLIEGELAPEAAATPEPGRDQSDGRAAGGGNDDEGDPWTRHDRVA